MDSPPDTKGTQSPNAPGNNPLQLDPGAPQRKPRSMGKLCLWLGILTCVGFLGVLSFLFYIGLRHPHIHMYYNGPEFPKTPQVVWPLITKDSTFDVIASVWIRDDNANDGVISIDGEDRSERLLYTGTVFRDITLESDALTNVTFSVPTRHFTRANISNYDLRASFVLDQPDLYTWPYEIVDYTSWRPRGIRAPTVRKWEYWPSLQDLIYDSFGITVPLIQFRNISSKKDRSNTSDTSDNPIQGNIEQQPDLGDESDWDDDESIETPPEEENERNTQGLEFTDDRKPVTEYHPYIVTRTHLHITDQDRAFERQVYSQKQEELASQVCIHSRFTTPPEHLQWYQCLRSYNLNGVFETKIALEISPDSGLYSEDEEMRKGWMYAPYLSTIWAHGPKDLVPIPVDREVINESAPQVPTPDEEYVNITWKISFSGHTHDILFLKDQGIRYATTNTYNMTMPDNELEYLQHEHESTMGLMGYKLHEDTHPRRKYALQFLTKVGQIICVAFNIHYWYTRVSTAGISRLGTTFIAFHSIMNPTETVLLSTLSSEASRTSLMMILVTYISRLILPCVMLKASARLRFGWSMNAGDSKSEGWIPRVYFSEATHLERSSDRVEGRISGKVKFALLISVFSLLHFMIPLSSYIVTPRVPRPAAKPHPLHSLSPHSATVLEYTHSVSPSLYATGSILQFIMNRSSRTYAGKYKITAFLWLFSELLKPLDLMSSAVGKAAGLDGIHAAETIALVVAVVDTIQAMMYQTARTSDIEDTE